MPLFPNKLLCERDCGTLVLEKVDSMASSLLFNPKVETILPIEVIQRLRIMPFSLKNDPDVGTKLCLIARRPLSDDALYELKSLTGITDYEIQLVGEDVLDAYINKHSLGTLFDY